MAGEADDALFMLEAATRGPFVVVVPKSVARDAIVSGRVRVLAQFEPSQSGVHALFQDGTSAELARAAVALLVAHARQLVD
jgi:DNA-binding transcriptional LysR family regulator